MRYVILDGFLFFFIVLSKWSLVLYVIFWRLDKDNACGVGFCFKSINKLLEEIFCILSSCVFFLDRR